MATKAEMNKMLLDKLKSCEPKQVPKDWTTDISDCIETAEPKKIDIVSKKILNKYLKAFKELADD